MTASKVKHHIVTQLQQAQERGLIKYIGCYNEYSTQSNLDRWQPWRRYQRNLSGPLEASSELLCIALEFTESVPPQNVVKLIHHLVYSHDTLQCLISEPRRIVINFIR